MREREKEREKEGEASRPEYYGKTNARNKVNYTIATRGGDGWNGMVELVGGRQTRERESGA